MTEQEMGRLREEALEVSNSTSLSNTDILGFWIDVDETLELVLDKIRSCMDEEKLLEFINTFKEQEEFLDDIQIDGDLDTLNGDQY